MLSLPTRTVWISNSKKKTTMANSVKPIPEGYHTLTPYLVCRNAGGRKARGATSTGREPGLRVTLLE